MGKVEKRAVEVLVRGEGSKPRSPRREHSQLPVGGRTDPATPASDLSSELWQALYLALSKCWHKPRNASGPAQPSSNHSRSPTQLSCPPALPLPHPVMDPIPDKSGTGPMDKPHSLPPAQSLAAPDGIPGPGSTPDIPQGCQQRNCWLVAAASAGAVREEAPGHAGGPQRETTWI